MDNLGALREEIEKNKDLNLGMRCRHCALSPDGKAFCTFNPPTAVYVTMVPKEETKDRLRQAQFLAQSGQQMNLNVDVDDFNPVSASFYPQIDPMTECCTGRFQERDDKKLALDILTEALKREKEAKRGNPEKAV